MKSILTAALVAIFLAGGQTPSPTGAPRLIRNARVIGGSDAGRPLRRGGK